MRTDDSRRSAPATRRNRKKMSTKRQSAYSLLVPARALVSRAPVRTRPPQHLQVASSLRGRTRPLVPRAPVLARPPQHPQASPAALQHVSSHSHPLSRAHRNTSRWPLAAASSHVPESHGHPFRRAHCNTSRYSRAAQSHVCRPTGTRARAHFNTSRWPPSAAYMHAPVPRAPVLTRPLKHIQVASPATIADVSSSHGHPFSRAHRSISRASPRRAPARVLPTGTRSDAPTATPPGDLPAPRTRTSSRPTDTCVGAATGAPPGGLPSRACTRVVPRHLPDAPTGRTPPGGLHQPRPSTWFVPRHPFRRAHSSASRCPPCAAYAHALTCNLYPFAHKNARMAILPRPAANRESSPP